MRKRSYTPPHNYTAAEIRFLEKKVAGRSYAELTELFNRRFGLSFTVSRLNSALGRLGLRNGRDCRFRPGNISLHKIKKGEHISRNTEFRPGNRPHTWRPVGTERVNGEGYTEIRIRNPSGKPWKNWKAKHRMI
ncbi:MAG: hypothetical protein LBR93_11700 [Treponema sp.]|jgi:hypothetical protein|nr:hypothetical protein [Treponema sp.]